MATEPRDSNSWGFSAAERNLFVALASFAVVFLVILVLPALTREGSPAAPGSAAGSALAGSETVVREVPVVMTEFAFRPAAFQFEAGDRAKFIVENQGKVAHEFRLTSHTAVDTHIEGGHDDHDDSQELSGGDLWVLAAPGETQTLEVTFTQDSTFDLVACLLPGHYEAGMRGSLSIAGATVGAAGQDGAEAGDADGEALHDEGAGHDDGEAAHDDEEAAHDEGAGHDDGEAAHDDEEAADDEEAGHDDGEAAHDDEAAVVADRDITVAMTEFAFEPASLEVTRGETIRFILDNQGVIQHEFRLSTEHSVEEHIAAGHQDHGDEAAGEGHGHGDVIVLVDGGETDTVVVTFDDGAEFEIVACLLPGHYEAGMWGTLTITS